MENFLRNENENRKRNKNHSLRCLFVRLFDRLRKHEEFLPQEVMFLVQHTKEINEAGRVVKP